MRKAHIAAHLCQRDGARAVFDFHRQIEILEHALEADHGRFEFDAHVGQGRDGAVKLTEVIDKGDDRADGERAGQHQASAPPEDERSADRTDNAEAQEEPAADQRPAHANGAHVGVDLAEALHLITLAAKQLDQQGAVDIERLVHQRVHAGVVFHRPPRNIAQDDADAPRGQEEERKDDQRQDGQAPLQGDHDEEAGNQADDVGHDVDQRAGDRVLRADHIVVEARHQLAGLGVGEKAQRLALHVRVKLLAQVVDDAFTDAGAQVTLPDADQPADDGDGDHADRQPVQTRQVAIGQRVVNQVTVKQGRYQPQPRRDGDGQQHQRGADPVGPGVTGHAAKQAAGDLWFAFGFVVL